jgi:hypothetical protein
LISLRRRIFRGAFFSGIEHQKSAKACYPENLAQQNSSALSFFPEKSAKNMLSL